jgi:aryl-alcohol dehydrogenase-like predicted oxidoreductase
LAGGFLSERYLGIKEFQDPLENRSLVKYRLIIEEFGGVEMFQAVLLTLKRIAEKHNVGIAEIASQYILQKPSVAGVILGARDVSHLENIRKLNFLRLDNEDLREIQTVIAHARGPKGPVYHIERDRTSKHGKIMKYNLNNLYLDRNRNCNA